MEPETVNNATHSTGMDAERHTGFDLLSAFDGDHVVNMASFQKVTWEGARISHLAAPFRIRPCLSGSDMRHYARVDTRDDKAC
jgi:hypothetical protein